jgi:hypothetical protein
MSNVFVPFKDIYCLDEIVKKMNEYLRRQIIYKTEKNDLPVPDIIIHELEPSENDLFYFDFNIFQ